MSARRTKRTDGRYGVTVRLERRDGTVRRTYFYGRTQAEAKAKALAARERVGRGEPVRDATRTVSDWLAEWRTTFLRASDRAESTKDLYAGLTVHHVEPLIGHLALGQVRPTSRGCFCTWSSEDRPPALGAAPTPLYARPRGDRR